LFLVGENKEQMIFIVFINYINARSREMEFRWVFELYSRQVVVILITRIAISATIHVLLSRTNSLGYNFYQKFSFLFCCIDENIKYNFVILYISESMISTVDYFDPNYIVYTRKCESFLHGKQIIFKYKLK